MTAAPEPAPWTLAVVEGYRPAVTHPHDNLPEAYRAAEDLTRYPTTSAIEIRDTTGQAVVTWTDDPPGGGTWHHRAEPGQTTTEALAALEDLLRTVRQLRHIDP